MPGLSIAVRHGLLTELQRRVLDRPRLGDGSRCLALTLCDAKVYGALALDFHNGRSGRCDPGFRAIAVRAAVGLGTVGTAIRRLAAAGWVRLVRFLRYAHGSLRWCYAYVLPEECPKARSTFAAKPFSLSKTAVDKPKAQPPVRSVAAQLAYLAKEFGLPGRPAARPDTLRKPGCPV